ncbi:MAG: methyltransferase domain-containing protein [Lachnospiraceae bacterium]|nr:methyltransferase domain-containing protein [Lachnospiraceae bacterium]
MGENLERGELLRDQEDIRVVCFKEEETAGAALNHVISHYGITGDTLVLDGRYIPLKGSIERMEKALGECRDAFAVGVPLSSVLDEKEMAQKSNEDMEQLFADSTGYRPAETLTLFEGMILFSGSVIAEEEPFHPEAGDFGNAMWEKCMREYLAHKRMYKVKEAFFLETSFAKGSRRSSVDSQLFEKQFGIHYATVGGNRDVIDIVSETADHDLPLRILEIGCDCGGNLFELKQIFKNAQLFGTDISEGALKVAAEFATVKWDNIEDLKLDFGENEFDFILFADVLEHLRDPLKVLVYCKKLLANGGRIVASIPNLMNVEVMRMLLDGHFTYAEYGLLDKTHIHMFTYHEIVKMFVDQAGYSIERMSMNGALNDEDEALVEKLLSLGGAEKFMYQAYQYQVVARL